MSNSTLSDVLRRLLRSRNMNALELSRHTGVPQPTIHRMLTGNAQKPHSVSVEPIAEYFNISIPQLMGLEEIPWLSDFKDELYKQIGMHRAPLLTWEQVTGWLTDKQNSLGESLRKVTTDLEVSKKSFALIMEDSSMYPLFPLGTQVILDPEKSYQPGSYILVKLENQSLPILRQLTLEEGREVLKPLSPNTEQYPIQNLTEPDCILACLVEAKLRFDTKDLAYE